MVPNLGDIERIVRKFFRLFFAHHLNVELPLREVTAGNGVVEVAAMVVAVRSSNLLGFLIAKAFDALLGLEVEFDPNPFSFFVN